MGGAGNKAGTKPTPTLLLSFKECVIQLETPCPGVSRQCPLGTSAGQWPFSSRLPRAISVGITCSLNTCVCPHTHLFHGHLTKESHGVGIGSSGLTCVLGICCASDSTIATPGQGHKVMAMCPEHPLQHCQGRGQRPEPDD